LVAVRLPGANVYDDPAVEFVVGGEMTCGFWEGEKAGGVPMESRAPGRALSALHILLSDIPVNHITVRLTGIPDMVEKERGRG
jgi:hypothetical protein